MKNTVFLVADYDGVVRMTKRYPSLHRSEIAIQLRVTIPDGCFKAPALIANVEVPEDRVLQPSADIEVLPIPQEDEANG
jgi:hypothetical protein